MKEISETKPRLGRGRGGLRCKKTIPINKPIAQTTEIPPTVLAPKSPKTEDTIISIPSYAIPQIET